LLHSNVKERSYILQHGICMLPIVRVMYTIYYQIFRI